MFYQVWELERFQTAKLTFKVIQGHPFQQRFAILALALGMNNIATKF